MLNAQRGKMGCKKIDKRIRYVIENCVSYRYRSMFFILGEKAREQLVFLYRILSKSREDANIPKPTVLWCYKKDLGFNMFHHKRLRQLKKKFDGSYSVCKDDVFDIFLVSSNIQFCHFR
ncbi:RNA cytidine acetyltransferase-like [Stegodyphus dumicola]|uniref:RNA cytidine acetyltransferase-like n=1 Tax=Stegodyphus dumicola TaxID=202533 RepID=UPI0015B0054E|nr:RNA cytidine acetyltransferase-like [Stegodyphus dumicola]